MKNWLQNREQAYQAVKAKRYEQLAKMSSIESFREFLEIWELAKLAAKGELPKADVTETLKVHSELVKKFNALK